MLAKQVAVTIGIALAASGLALAIEPLTKAFTLALVAGLMGFLLGLILWRLEPTVTRVFVLTLLSGITMATTFTFVKVLVYAIAAEAAGYVSLAEFFLLMIGSGVLQAMLFLNTVIVVGSSMMGAALSLLLKALVA